MLRYLLGTLDLLPRLDLEGQPVRNAGQYISLSTVDTLVGRANFTSLSLALLGLRLIMCLHARSVCRLLPVKGLAVAPIYREPHLFARVGLSALSQIVTERMQ